MQVYGVEMIAVSCEKTREIRPGRDGETKTGNDMTVGTRGPAFDD